MTAVEQAEALAQAGRADDAYQVLQASAPGDLDALFVQALWRLTGQFVPRDLAAARTLFGRAAQRGHPTACSIHEAFLANGTGGPRAWPDALAALQSRARTDPEAQRQTALLDTMTLNLAGDPVPSFPARPLHATQPIGIIPSLFTAAECSYLIDAARPMLQPSVVIDPASGRTLRDPIRTSYAAAFPLVQETLVIHALNRRIAAATATRADRGEPLQILSYRVGQQYRPHLDILPHAPNQRVATVIVYLNEDYEGGETQFPELGLAVRGGIGDALFFANVDASGQPEPRMRHAGAPVQRGVKFVASRWIRAAPLDLG